MKYSAVAFLFGAGSSQPYGVPTMKPFYDQFHAHMLKHFPSCLPALDFPGIHDSPRDLETVIGTLQSLIQTRQTLALAGQADAELPLAVRVAEQAYGYLSAFVVDACERFSSDKAQKEFAPLIRLMTEHSCWCFTTNYDRIIEVVAAALDLRISDGFETPAESTVGRWANEFRETGLRLAKLHGSVTWYEEESGSGQVRLDRGYALPSSEYRLVRHDRQLRPLMIIPTLEKDLGRPPYAPLVVRLLDALAAARLLIVVGSSLRDAHLRSHIATRQRENGLVVLLIDPAAALLRERYSNELEIFSVSTGISELAILGALGLSRLVQDVELKSSPANASVKASVQSFVDELSHASDLSSQLERLEPELQVAVRTLMDYGSAISDRVRAVGTVGEFRHPAVAGALTRAATSDPAEQVRIATVAPLLLRGDTGAIDIVRRVAEFDSSENARLEALLGLCSEAPGLVQDDLLEKIRSSAPRESALYEISDQLRRNNAADTADSLTP